MQPSAPISVGIDGSKWDRVTTMHAPKFSIGQAVGYFPPRGVSAQRCAYRVTAELPLRSGQFEYRIKHQFEDYDRVAPESDLTMLWN